jgi:hypothetical protein
MIVTFPRVERSRLRDLALSGSIMRSLRRPSDTAGGGRRDESRREGPDRPRVIPRVVHRGTGRATRTSSATACSGRRAVRSASVAAAAQRSHGMGAPRVRLDKPLTVTVVGEAVLAVRRWGVEVVSNSGPRIFGEGLRRTEPKRLDHTLGMEYGGAHNKLIGANVGGTPHPWRPKGLRPHPERGTTLCQGRQHSLLRRDMIKSRFLRTPTAGRATTTTKAAAARCAEGKPPTARPAPAPNAAPNVSSSTDA